jgi:hypothetical protein
MPQKRNKLAMPLNWRTLATASLAGAALFAAFGSATRADDGFDKTGLARGCGE